MSACAGAQEKWPSTSHIDKNEWLRFDPEVRVPFKRVRFVSMPSISEDGFVDTAVLDFMTIAAEEMPSVQLD